MLDAVTTVADVTRAAFKDRAPVTWQGKRGRIARVFKPATGCIVRWEDGSEQLFTHRAAWGEYRAFPGDPGERGLLWA